MKLWDELHLSQAELPCVIAIVGSGGKTSIMGQLAKEGKEHNLRVAVLTTTHIRKPPEYQEVFSRGAEGREATSQRDHKGRGSITIYGIDCGEDKLTYPGDACYEEICKHSDLILVEADGSGGLPVKYPATHEPVIPEHTNVILCVLGMSGLGCPGEAVCHRWELAREKVLEQKKVLETGGEKGTNQIPMAEEALLTEKTLAELLEAGYGKPLQQSYPKAAFYYCLNQADTGEMREAAAEILYQTGRQGIILSLLGEENILYAAKKCIADTGKEVKIAMIYMASGFGRRYGSNKLLEEIEGMPLYLHGLQALQQAAELIQKKTGQSSREADKNQLQVQLVVVSQYKEILHRACELGVQAVYNPDSQKGITASIHYGIQAAPDADVYLFAVADQPWMKARSIYQLVKKFCSGEETIGCLWDGKTNGNPVIFSKRHKEELLRLTGDRGGSVIMQKYPEEVLREVVEEKELRDIDERID